MRKLTVLTIDNNPLQLASIESQLKTMGVQHILNCPTPMDAIDVLSSTHVDIIFCDLFMPEMDGILFIRRLGEFNYKGVLVILSDADDTILMSLKHMGYKLGFSKVYKISKPAREFDLVRILGTESIIHQHDDEPVKKIAINPEMLSNALANGEFKNYYQPQVEFSTGKMIGVEVLSRWVHPTQGLIFPDTFVPLIHDAHLERKLFDVVLNGVLSDIQRGQLTSHASINITQSDLECPNFTDHVLAQCQQFNVAPSCLTLELTEREIYNDSLNLITNVSRLRMYGIGLSIDDFGTGSSSYLKLSQLPFTEIKIDRSFVYKCQEDETKVSIVKSLCILSKNMNVKLVAEGVEDEESWSLMKQYGVDICQGYYTGRPMPIEALSMFMKE